MTDRSLTRSERTRRDAPVYLLDTNAILEAVRTGTWSALTGGLSIQTVGECFEECLRGDRFSSGYIQVTVDDLDHATQIHAVSDIEQATLALRTDASALDASALDAGERDLFAHALGRPEDDEAWLICSSDRACVLVGVALGWKDRLVSLEMAIEAVGATADPPLRRHFKQKWLSVGRTRALLAGP